MECEEQNSRRKSSSKRGRGSTSDGETPQSKRRHSSSAILSSSTEHSNRRRSARLSQKLSTSDIGTGLNISGDVDIKIAKGNQSKTERTKRLSSPRRKSGDNIGSEAKKSVTNSPRNNCAEKGNCEALTIESSSSKDRSAKLLEKIPDLSLVTSLPCLTSPNKSPLEHLRGSKSRKSRRRSSFAPERQKLEIPAVDTGIDLYADIDGDKPNEERFYELMIATLQHTFKIISKTPSYFKGMEKHVEKIKESMLQHVEDLKADGTIGNAANKPKYLPNPANIELENSIREIQDLIKSCNYEVSTWGNLIDEVNLQIADKQKENTNFSMETLNPESRVIVKTLISKELDYEAMYNKMLENMQKTKIIASQFSQCVTQVQAVYQLVDQTIRNQCQQLEASTFSGILLSSPRKVIEEMTEMLESE